MRYFRNVLVTGGAGFIGGNFVHYLFRRAGGFAGRVIVLDALTYAGNASSLSDVERDFPDRYAFVRADICDADAVRRAFADYDVDAVVHFAAESHVDRSILGPEAFVRTNVLGTFNLLEAARSAWGFGAGKPREGTLFHHVSTDEVYGSLGPTGYFTEDTPYDPRSPYSASKASSDHLAFAYHHTYGLPVTLSNCSNNYGPYHFPEKLIPLMILNILEGKPLPVYGDGKNVRDWLYVEDHCDAVWRILTEGTVGRKYNVGGENEVENIRIVNTLIDVVSRKAGLDPERVRSTISYVADRPGHDRRYAIDCSRIKQELGWSQSVSFDEGIDRTVEWYLRNMDWVAGIKSGEYTKWIERNYDNR